MNHTSSVHPNTVYDAILATARHPTKKHNLLLVQDVCSERAKMSSKDFSLKSIGEIVEARGGPKLKALWNSQSADYRKLIEAWQSYVGAPNRREPNSSGQTNAVTQNIADPATRIVVEKLFQERNALRVEVNILKANSKLTIDRRPQIATPDSAHSANGSMTLEISSGPKLNTLEQEALAHSISLELWLAEGWKEEANGRIVKSLGEGRTRTIFKPGFISAVRKILK